MIRVESISRIQPYAETTLVRGASTMSLVSVRNAATRLVLDGLAVDAATRTMELPGWPALVVEPDDARLIVIVPARSGGIIELA